jgi:hypothetical protein
LDGQATTRRWSASAAQPTPATDAWASPCGLATAASSSGSRFRPSVLSWRTRARSMEMQASSPACLRLSSARRSSVRALLTDGECTEPNAPPYRRRCLDTDPPLSLGRPVPGSGGGRRHHTIAPARRARPSRLAGCGAAPWPPLAAHLVRAAIGPWRLAPQHAVMRHVPQPWTDDSMRHVA